MVRSAHSTGWPLNTLSHAGQSLDARLGQRNRFSETTKNAGLTAEETPAFGGSRDPGCRSGWGEKLLKVGALSPCVSAKVGGAARAVSSGSSSLIQPRGAGRNSAGVNGTGHAHPAAGGRNAETSLATKPLTHQATYSRNSSGRTATLPG